MMNFKRAYIVFWEQDKKLIKEINKYCLITGWDFTLEAAATWAKDGGGEDPELFLINGAVYFSGTGKKKGTKSRDFLRLLLTIKRYRPRSRIVLLLPEDRVTDKELVLNLLKMRVYDFWFLAGFDEKDVQEFIVSKRTLDEVEQYLEKVTKELHHLFGHLSGGNNLFSKEHEKIFKPYHIKSNVMAFWSEDNTLVNYGLAVLTALNLAGQGFKVALVEPVSHAPCLAGCLSVNHPYYNTGHALSMYIQGNNDFIKSCLYNNEKYLDDPYSGKERDHVKYFPPGLFLLPDMKRDDNAAQLEMEEHWRDFATELFRLVIFERGFHFLIFVGTGKDLFNDVILDEVAYTKFITVDMLPPSILKGIAEREKEPDRIHLVGTRNVSYINKEFISLNEAPFLYPPEGLEKDFLNYVYTQDYRKITRDTQIFINNLLERIGIKLPSINVEKKGIVEMIMEYRQALFK
jgi:hypothetical protein